MALSSMEAPIEPRLAERLQTTYLLSQPPATPRHFAELLRARLDADPRSREFLRRVRDGSAVIGETRVDRGQTVVIPGEREANVMCGYDSLMTAVLRGRGIVRAACFHCGEPVEVHIEGDRVTRVEPATAVFWLGDGPKGIPVCDHFNLFPSLDHLTAWLEGNPEELGVPLSVESAILLCARAKAGL